MANAMRIRILISSFRDCATRGPSGNGRSKHPYSLANKKDNNKGTQGQVSVSLVLYKAESISLSLTHTLSVDECPVLTDLVTFSRLHRGKNATSLTMPCRR